MCSKRDHKKHTVSNHQKRMLLKNNTKRCTVKSKSARPGNVEINLEIRLKEDNTDFVNRVSELSGVKSAVLVSYNGDFMG